MHQVVTRYLAGLALLLYIAGCSRHKCAKHANVNIQTSEYGFRFYLPKGFALRSSDTFPLHSVNARRHYYYLNNDSIKFVLWYGFMEAYGRDSLSIEDYISSRTEASGIPPPNSKEFDAVRKINGTKWAYFTQTVNDTAFVMKQIINIPKSNDLFFTLEANNLNSKDTTLFNFLADSIFNSVVIEPIK